MSAVDQDDLAEFERHRPQLFGVAYRMLGTASDAEDAVHDTYLRWAAADRSLVVTPAAWLTKALTNVCLNRLTSARARRESYIGAWLPEPVLTDDHTLGPMETAEQRESVSVALLILMERLNPTERAVFVLREAFGYPHREIADILDTSEANSQQLYRRARQQLGRERRFEPSRDTWQAVVERFLRASRDGDLGALERILADDAASWADGGGRLGVARRSIVGATDVARYLLGLDARAKPIEDLQIRIADVNGAPGAYFTAGGQLLGVIVPEVHDDHVVTVRVMVNPDKLTFLARQLSLSVYDGPLSALFPAH
jgi:RNA polymerase sigma-70 factor (ECF subfamily)